MKTLYVLQIYGDSGQVGAYNLQYQVGTEEYARKVVEGYAVLDAKLVRVDRDEPGFITELAVAELASNGVWNNSPHGLYWEEVNYVDLNCYETSMTPPHDDLIFSLKKGKKIKYGPRLTLLQQIGRQLSLLGERIGFYAV